MNNQIQPAGSGKFAANAGAWLRTLKKLAETAGCAEAADPVLQSVVKMNRGDNSVVFFGAANAGKSRLINNLLQRNLLPVNVAASATPLSVFSAGAGQPETVASAIDSSQVELTEDGVESIFDQVTTPDAVTEVCIHNDWLKHNRLRLMEPLALNSDVKEADIIPDGCLLGVDMAVLVIDALMPLNRLESVFLSECERRHTPVVIALARLDRLSETESEDVVSYVRKHCRSGTSAIDVYPVDTSEGVDGLRNHINAAFATGTPSIQRERQMTYVLMEALTIVRAAAGAGHDAVRQSRAELQRSLIRRQHEMESQNLIWEQIEQTLQQKRQQMDSTIRTHLREHRETVLKNVTHELERCADVKLWWERDLPFRLQREFQFVSERLSLSIGQKIASDLNWLGQALEKQFRYSLHTLAEPGVTLKTADVPAREVTLSDSNKLRILSRCATAGTVVAAGTLFATSGIGGIAIAASVVTSLVADQLIRMRTKEDREKVKGELRRTVELVERDYASEISRKLQEGYNEIVAQLRKHQFRWQQGQLQALKTASQSDHPVDWKDLLAKTDALTAEINTYPAFDEPTHHSEESL